MVRLQTVRDEDRELLWNLIQKYLYEMTVFYNDPLDENGNYPYSHFGDYFSDPRRTAYLIFSDETPIGFALLCPYSSIGRKPDFTMAEFTIFPAYRGKRYATEAAKRILGEHPGKWEIKYNEKNRAAKKFWDRVTEPYHPERHRLNAEEKVLVFEVER